MRSAALILLLAGCQTCPVPPTVVPKIVHVPVEKIVAVPVELAVDCDEVAKKGNSYGEAVRLANARLESLKKCNADKKRIRELK